MFWFVESQVFSCTVCFAILQANFNKLAFAQTIAAKNDNFICKYKKQDWGGGGGGVCSEVGLLTGRGRLSKSSTWHMDILGGRAVV